MRLGALFEEARDARDEMRVVIGKAAPPSILTTRGLMNRIRSLYLAIRRVVTPTEREALERMIEKADRDWRRVRDRPSAIAEIAEEMRGLGPVVAALALPIFEKHGLRVTSETRVASRNRFRLKIPEALSDLDRRLVRFVSESQTNFVTDEYRRRAVALSARMRKLVAEGIEENLFRDPFTRMLAKDLDLMTLGRSKHYFDVVSRIYINRGRTLSSLSSYEEAGVTRYEFVAVLDSRTSDICRMMHGKTWDVSEGVERFAEASRLRDPEKIRDLSPFVQRGKDEKGRPILYYRKGERRIRVARITESGVGRVGERGKYSGELSKERLARAGITFPPLH